MPLLFQLTVNILSLYILIRAFSMRPVPKVRYFVILSLCVFFYSLGYLLELDAHSLEAAYMAHRIRYYGIAIYAVFFYLFIREYVNRGIKKRWHVMMLFIYPCIALVMLNAYPDTTLYFKKLGYAAYPTPHLVVERGVLFHLHVLYCFFFILLSTWEIIRYLPNHTKKDRQKKWMFLLSAIPPSLATIIFSIEILPIPMQFGSAFLVLSLLILGRFIIYHRAEDWLPFAREKIVENMSDGYILIDNDNRFVDANAIALEFFPAMKHAAPGDPVSRLEGFPCDLIGTSDTVCDVPVDTPNGSLVLRASTTPLFYDGKPLCTSIMLYDVTELHAMMNNLEKLATVDEMTGLLNRATFFRIASRDLSLHMRTQQPATLLMIDVDHFKHVNDRYGHLRGDEVLREMAELIRNRMRQTDIGGRYGGEEFCLFLPATRMDGALSIAEDIRVSAENQVFRHNDETFHVTISIGLAELNPNAPDCHESLEALIEEADAALYHAKNTGRNRIYTSRKIPEASVQKNMPTLPEEIL